MPATDLDFPFADPPPPGRAIEIRPGLRWARFALPFRLDHVNVWLLEDADGWSLIDCGLYDERTREQWEQLLAGDLAKHPIRRVFVTHFHPDHVGCAGWLAERFHAEFHMPRSEWLFARMLTLEQGEEAVTTWSDWYRRHGVAPEIIGKMVGRGGYYARSVATIPTRYRRLLNGETHELSGRAWRVAMFGGHAPEQATFDCAGDGLFISADQLLPQISPNVSVTPAEPEGDPLTEFLASLDAMDAIGDDRLVLPMHGLPFRGLTTRVAQLRAHHEHRLARVLELTAKPATIVELCAGLFRRDLDLQQLGFAIGEALAHANHLLRQGTLRRVADESGVDHYIRN
jgi:glyoxylase-like metal-dependent hydrolase (beta-lactamase superfamily II)